MIDFGVHYLGHNPVHSLLQHSRPAHGTYYTVARTLSSRAFTLLWHNLLKHKLSDVISQLVLIQMGAPSVVRKMIRDKVVHSLFQI